jgi:hypothetical protein
MGWLKLGLQLSSPNLLKSQTLSVLSEKAYSKLKKYLTYPYNIQTINILVHSSHLGDGENFNF